MKNYEKPMVLANEELAEGVYAASGSGEGCFKYDATSGGTYHNDSGYYEYNVNFKSHDGYHAGRHKFTIYLSMAPVDVQVSSQGNASTLSFSGSVVTVEDTQDQANGGESRDIGLLIRWPAGSVGSVTGGYGEQA